MASWGSVKRGCAALAGTCIAVLAAVAAPLPARADEAPALVFDVRSHTGPVRRLAVDPAGRWLVTASDDKTALVWDLATQRVRHTLRVPVGDDEAGRLYGAAISPDGRSVAVAGRTAGTNRIQLFDLASGTFRAAFDAGDGAVRALAWSPDGALLAAAAVGPGALRVFRADGTRVHEQRLGGDAYGLSISPQGQLAVSAFDGRVRLYRLAGGAVQAEGEIATSLADPVGVRHSPDGTLLAVGYFSRAARQRVVVDVFDATSRARVRQLDATDLPLGNLMSVGWQADGRALYAGGTGYAEAGRFVVKRFAWPGGGAEAAAVAADSIQDFAALPDGRMAFASFDATWGLLDGLKTVARSATPATRAADAAALRIAPDASTVQWRGSDGRLRSFALATRRAGEGDAAASVAAQPSSSALRVTDWENTRTPRIAGSTPALQPNESSRAAALLPAGDAVVLATSRALRRFGRDGTPAWSVPLHTEARAVAVSADGRTLVAALADGTLRWRRTADGAPLLSLLLLDDGRWVLWTESGHFDAGPGAEDLVGWLVARPGGDRVDYFGVSRLRDRLLRPDVIDRVLAEGDAARAVALANEARLAQAKEAAPEVVKTLEATLAALPVAQALPPVVTIAAPAKLQTAAATLAVDLRLFAPGGERIDKVSVRVDGRPVEATLSKAASLAGGETEGRMVVQLPKAEGKLQVFAEGKNGVSMPAEIDFSSSDPALRQLADRRPTLYLLAVGVSRYANPDFNLGLAAKDANDFARTFQAQQGLAYKKVEARVLQDAEATRANVLAGLRWLQQSAGADDVAILFLAGHGVADAGDVYHFLPHDMRENQLAASAVSENQLRSTLSSIKGRAIFFVDTCFAGKSVGKFTRRELTRMANGMASAELGVIVFSGSAPRQESLEDPAWGNGAFTKALIDGLRGRADFRREGLVTHKGLDYFVAFEVRQLTQGKQTPVTAVPNGIADFPVASVSASPQNNPGARP